MVAEVIFYFGPEVRVEDQEPHVEILPNGLTSCLFQTPTGDQELAIRTSRDATVVSLDPHPYDSALPMQAHLGPHFATGVMQVAMELIVPTTGMVGVVVSHLTDVPGIPANTSPPSPFAECR